MAALNCALNILWIVIAATNDNQVLEAARDEQFTVIKETEVAGSHKRASITIGQTRSKRIFGFFRTPPIALRNTGADHPDFPHLTRGTGTQRLGIDHNHLLFSRWLTETYQCILLRLGSRHGYHKRVILFQRAVIKGDRAATARATDKERCLRQTVARQESLAAKTTYSKSLRETC